MLGARDRDRDAAKRDLALAHTNAAFVRAQKLERLDHYLNDRPAMTIAEKITAMQARGVPMRLTVQKRGA